MECVLDVKVTGTMKFMGDDVKTEISVSEEELYNAVKYCLEKHGHEPISIEVEKGIRTRTEGYGTGETTKEVPYFDGVSVEVKDNVKRKEMPNGKF